jgi:ATP-dependent Lon protease
VAPELSGVLAHPASTGNSARADDVLMLVLLPVSSHRQLHDLSDDMATKVDVMYYGDAKDALLNAVLE